MNAAPPYVNIPISRRDDIGRDPCELDVHEHEQTFATDSAIRRLYEQFLPAAVKVVGRSKSGDGSSWAGSGFYLDDDRRLVATALHVVNKKGYSWEIWDSDRQRHKLPALRVEPISWSLADDLAIMLVDEPHAVDHFVAPRIATADQGFFGCDRTRDLDDRFVLAFGHLGYKGALWAAPGKITGIDGHKARLSCILLPSMSGGATVDSAGEVISIHHRGPGHALGEAIDTDAAMLSKLLQWTIRAYPDLLSTSTVHIVH